MSFGVDDIKLSHFNERDVEMPALLSAVREETGTSFLDVGACYSWYTYANGLREIIGQRTYDACDVLPDEKTAKIVDRFFVGNVCELDLPQYDMVMCVSAVEHAGMTSYKVENWRTERDRVMRRLVQLSRRRLFMTFPFGLPGVYENQYANVTALDLILLGEDCHKAGMISQVRCFYTEFAQGQKPWVEIGLREAASIPMDKARGTQCVCLFDAKGE